MVREIRDVLNQYRQSLGLDPFYTDLLQEKPASEYAVYQVQNDEEPHYLDTLVYKHMEKVPYYNIVLVQKFESDMQGIKQNLCKIS